MSTTLKIAIIKLILINLIPVIGLIFLEWELLEVGITYILETCAIFLVYEIDLTFIDRNTRIPIVMGLIQLFFTALTFGGMMYGSAMIMYFIITPQIGEYNNYINDFFDKLEDMQILFPAISLFLIELVSYYVRKRQGYGYLVKNTWRVVRRILYSHLYMVVCLLVLSIFPQNMFVMVPFFIGLKIVLDYSVENEKIYRAMADWLLKTPIGRWFSEDDEKNSKPRGYFFKKRTYIDRNRRK